MNSRDDQRLSHLPAALPTCAGGHTWQSDDPQGAAAHTPAKLIQMNLLNLRFLLREHEQNLQGPSEQSLFKRHQGYNSCFVKKASLVGFNIY